MKITNVQKLLFCFLLGLELLLVSAKSWCREQPPTRRNWRFPPPPRPPPPPSGRIRGPPLQVFSFHRPPQMNLPGRPLLALYKHENHNGLKYEQFVGPRCYNLPNAINDKASSVDTNGRCVIVCKDKDCKRCRKMYPGSPGHFKLDDVNMDDDISSVKPCGDIYEHPL